MMREIMEVPLPEQFIIHHWTKKWSWEKSVKIFWHSKGKNYDLPLAASRDLISFLTWNTIRNITLQSLILFCLIEAYFPDFNILIRVLCIFTHFEGVVGAGGVETEVDKTPPLTSQALKIHIFLLHNFVKCRCINHFMVKKQGIGFVETVWSMVIDFAIKWRE